MTTAFGNSQTSGTGGDTRNTNGPAGSFKSPSAQDQSGGNAKSYYGSPQQLPAGQYGPPPSGHGAPAQKNDSYGVIGAMTAMLGAGALAVSFFAVDWFDRGDFGVVRTAIANNSLATGFSKAYFLWLAFVLAGVAFLVALLANAPSGSSGALRVFGAIVGLAGAGLSFLGIRVFAQDAYSDYLRHAKVGFWIAVAGFVLVAIGAMIGPRRRW